GAATRFGSDKTRYEVGGVALLDRVLRAVADAYDLLVVGERRATAVPVTWLREDPPGSGPANAVVAALPRVRAPRVVLLAGDLPFVDASTVRRLLAAGGDGGVLTDADGRRQYLCSAVRTDALVSAAGGTDWAGHSMRALLAPLDLRPCGARGREAHDVDTPEDVPSDP
ncbi:MAG: molybdenum cofactor guanylyltransferase, partial [Nocardioidaceae bacterium]